MIHLPELGFRVVDGVVDVLTDSLVVGSAPWIASSDDLLPTLRAALDEDGVSVISCPVDYSENLLLTDRLGQLDATL